MTKLWRMFRSNDGKSTWVVRNAEIIVCRQRHTGIQDRRRFELDNGTTLILKGYWFSNPQSLFEETGVHYLDLDRKKAANEN